MPLHMTLRDRIAAHPERVYAALTDLAGARQWMPNLVAIVPLTGGAFGAGTRWRETRRMFGREATEEFEVTAVEPGRRIDLFVDGVKGSSRRGWYRFRYELAPYGSGTALALHGEIGGMNRLMELVGRLFIGSFKKAWVKDLAALRRHVEGSARARVAAEA